MSPVVERRTIRGVTYVRQPRPTPLQLGQTFCLPDDAIWDGGVRGGLIVERDGRFLVSSSSTGWPSLRRAAGWLIGDLAKRYMQARRAVVAYEDALAAEGPVEDVTIWHQTEALAYRHRLHRTERGPVLRRVTLLTQPAHDNFWTIIGG